MAALAGKIRPRGAYPIPALKLVNQQAPTAELRPPDCKQTDEDDLMPYDVLDSIERAAIRDRRSPVEVYDIIRLQYPRHTASQLNVWVAAIF